jgi:hypothetical protein
MLTMPKIQLLATLATSLAGATFLYGVAESADPPPKTGPKAERTSTDRENSCWEARFPRCNGVERSKDLVFVYPRGLFRRDPAQVVKTLQRGWDLLRDMTGIDPGKIFGQRIVVGYYDPSDLKNNHPFIFFATEDATPRGFPGEFWQSINIPWEYLPKLTEPEGCMTHEMVHPFIHVKPLRTNANAKEWVEGACDFLRLPVYYTVGQPHAAEKSYKLYRSLAWKPGASYYHDHAGRLIEWTKRQGVDCRRPSQLKKILPKLWETDLEATLGKPLK